MKYLILYFMDLHGKQILNPVPLFSWSFGSTEVASRPQPGIRWCGALIKSSTCWSNRVPNVENIGLGVAPCSTITFTILRNPSHLSKLKQEALIPVQLRQQPTQILWRGLSRRNTESSVLDLHQWPVTFPRGFSWRHVVASGSYRTTMDYLFGS